MNKQINIIYILIFEKKNEKVIKEFRLRKKKKEKSHQFFGKRKMMISQLKKI